jgi:histone H3/H4
MVTAKTRVKDILRSSEYNIDKMSNDFIERLDLKVKTIILDAAKRAKENGRRTVMGRDI